MDVAPQVGLRSLAHQILQLRFRRMGKIFPSFYHVDREAKNIPVSQKRHYDLDVLRQTLSVSLLKTTIPSFLKSSSMACVIGDGFASMTSFFWQPNQQDVLFYSILQKLCWWIFGI